MVLALVDAEEVREAVEPAEDTIPKEEIIVE